MDHTRDQTPNPEGPGKPKQEHPRSPEVAAHAELSAPLRAQVPNLAGDPRIVDLRPLNSLSRTLKPVGTVESIWAGGQEGPSYWDKPIYGLRRMPAEISLNPDTHSQVLVDAIGGPHWGNAANKDLLIDWDAVNQGPVESKEGPGGFIIMAPARDQKGTPAAGFDVHIYPGSGQAPGKAWYGSYDSAEAAMRSLAMTPPPVFNAERSEDRMRTRIEQIRNMDQSEIDRIVNSLGPLRGEGQVRQIVDTRTRRDALETLTVGSGLPKAHWKELESVQDELLGDAMEAINERLPAGSEVFYDHAKDYAEEPALYYRDGSRPETPDMEVGTEVIRATQEHSGGVVLENHEGSTLFLQSEDDVLSVQHALHYDHVRSFQNGWSVTLPDPGYTFPKVKQEELESPSTFPVGTRIRTENGYTFTRTDEGWTDGDHTFDADLTGMDAEYIVLERNANHAG